MTKRVLAIGLAALAAVAASAGSAAAKAGARFEWTTRSAEAKQRLAELQQRIENFQFGSANVELAQKLVAADPQFAMGVYYLSAVTPLPENQKHLERAVELSKRASDGERRFIEAMNVARANQGAQVKDAIPLLEKLGADYPRERPVQVILGQVYQGHNAPERARLAFERANEIGPASARVNAFLANDDLLKGQYEKALQYLKKASELMPDDPVIMEHVGDAYLKLNDKANALTQYQKAMTKREKEKDKDPEKVQEKNELRTKIRQLKENGR